MSCTFWNMRRKLRQQLAKEKAVAEEKVVTDIATAQKEAKEKSEQTKAPKTENKTAKKGGAKINEETAN